MNVCFFLHFNSLWLFSLLFVLSSYFPVLWKLHDDSMVSLLSFTGIFCCAYMSCPLLPCGTLHIMCVCAFFFFRAWTYEPLEASTIISQFTYIVQLPTTWISRESTFDSNFVFATIFKHKYIPRRYIPNTTANSSKNNEEENGKTP